TPRAVRQQEAGSSRTEMGQGTLLHLVSRVGGVSPLWSRPIRNAGRENGPVNTVGEPDEGELHVRFDEGRLARRARRTSRLLYSVPARVNPCPGEPGCSIQALQVGVISGERSLRQSFNSIQSRCRTGRSST